MKFAKIVFTVAGIWGVAVTLPLYFLRGFVGRHSPPAIAHPEFYYGFVGVTLAWQLVFLLIGADPGRYRPMIILAVVEKGSYVLAELVLFVNHAISASQALPATTDLVLGVLFLAAFVTTKRAQVAE